MLRLGSWVEVYAGEEAGWKLGMITDMGIQEQGWLDIYVKLDDAASVRPWALRFVSMEHTFGAIRPPSAPIPAPPLAPSADEYRDRLRVGDDESPTPTF